MRITEDVICFLKYEGSLGSYILHVEYYSLVHLAWLVSFPEVSPADEASTTVGSPLLGLPVLTPYVNETRRLLTRTACSNDEW